MRRLRSESPARKATRASSSACPAGGVAASSVPEDDVAGERARIHSGQVWRFGLRCGKPEASFRGRTDESTPNLAHCSPDGSDSGRDRRIERVGGRARVRARGSPPAGYDPPCRPRLAYAPHARATGADGHGVRAGERRGPRAARGSSANGRSSSSRKSSTLCSETTRASRCVARCWSPTPRRRSSRPLVEPTSSWSGPAGGAGSRVSSSGSVGQHVAHHAHCPVVIVPNERPAVGTR